MPGRGDPVRSGSRDHDPLARLAPQHGWLCCQAAGWGHAIEAYRGAPGHDIGAAWGVPGHHAGCCAANWASGVCQLRSRRYTASLPGTGLRAKKTGHAAEQDRLDVLNAREAWFEGQLDLDSRKAGVHRRDLDGNQHDSQPVPLPSGRKAANGPPTRPSQDDDPGCRFADDRHGRADRLRITPGQDQTGCRVRRRTDGAEDIGRCRALVSHAWPSAG